MLVSFHVQGREGGPADKVFEKKILSDQREVGDFIFKTCVTFSADSPLKLP
jgi:hypothetical protein